MPGDNRVSAYLLVVLQGRLAAGNQYLVGAAMARQWGFRALAEADQMACKRQQMQAEVLLQCLAKREVLPPTLALAPVRMARNIKEQYQSHLEMGNQGVAGLAEAMAEAAASGDREACTLLERIREQEEEQVDWLETQLHRMGELGYENYCARQRAEASAH